MNASDIFRMHMARNSRNKTVASWLIGILSVIGVAVLWITGFGFLATVGLALLVLLIILFGSLGKLVSSFIIATLTLMFLPTIKEYVFIL